MTTGQILIVDDDALRTKMLTFLFRTHGYGVAAVANEADIEAAMRRHPVDLILRAVHPRNAATPSARETDRREIPVILLCMEGEAAHEAAALEGGADDFIALPCEHAVLLARVRAVLRRYRRGEDDGRGAVVRVGDARLDLGRLTFTGPGGETLLTPTEARLLDCLMRAPDAVVPRDALIEQVWGYESESANNRVDVYMRRLRHKVEAHPQERSLIQTIRGVGYIFDSGVAGTGAHHECQ